MAYKLIKMFQKDGKRPKTILSGLTLEEAQGRAKDKRSKGKGWFLGYTRE